jgi:hypothetical protein
MKINIKKNIIKIRKFFFILKNKRKIKNKKYTY